MELAITWNISSLPYQDLEIEYCELRSLKDSSIRKSIIMCICWYKMSKKLHAPMDNGKNHTNALEGQFDNQSQAKL